jgi:hypothetical protein
LRDDHHRKGSADNHHKTVQGIGDNGTHRRKRKRRGYATEITKYAPKRATATSDGPGNFRIGKPCTYCGRKHELACKLTDHPDANKDVSIPWTESRVE